MQTNALYGQLEIREELLQQIKERFLSSAPEPEPEPVHQYWPAQGHAYKVQWVPSKKNCKFCYWLSMKHQEGKSKKKKGDEKQTICCLFRVGLGILFQL